MINKRVVINMKVYPETKRWLEELKEINPDATWDMIFDALKNRVPLPLKPQCKSTIKTYTLKQLIVYPSNAVPISHGRRVIIEDVIDALPPE